MRLEIKDIEIGYWERSGDFRRLTEPLSLSAPEGQTIALLGRNGTGKSTLLRVLAGVRKPLSGSVLLDGTELERLTPRERAQRIAFVTTEPVAVAHLRVREVVSMGRSPYTGWFGGLSAADERRVDRALEQTGLESFGAKTLDSLSDGERQRVMIARAVAQDTPLILLDEPTAFLDLPNRYRTALLLRRLAREAGKTVLYSSHDLTTAVQLCDTLWVMDRGGITAGSPADLLRDGTISSLFEGLPLRCSADGSIRFEASPLDGATPLPYSSYSSSRK